MTSPRHPAAPSGRRLLGLSLATLGVVYGDLGTSPLYALRVCFAGPHSLPVTRATVLGVLSLVFWSLVVVVSLKYQAYVLRLDNRGEGGVLALMALVRGRIAPRRAAGVVTLGLLGTALLYGDGILTPAVSVLSAVEGLEVAGPLFAPLVVPVTVVILLALFALQRQGTSRVGALFGPVMVAWFVLLAGLGLAGILRHPAVLAALDPRWAVRLFAGHGAAAFLVLGAVFLVTTGGETLYADLGHFGRRPIRLVWFGLVLPALVLVYFGQGALLLAGVGTGANPFWRLVPAAALLPVVALATAATVIASQAVISGVFSLTRQAVQLGFLPRLHVVHTSAQRIGQIFVPAANLVLGGATIVLVVAFRSAANLAAAYGLAVSVTMTITTLLAFVATRRLWGWSLPTALLVTGAFLVVDLAFVGANAFKIEHGAWVPIAAGAVGYLVMSTWLHGRRALGDRERSGLLPFELFQRSLAERQPLRVPGTAVVLTGMGEGTPRSLLHNFKHNRVIHEHVVLLTVLTEELPRVPEAERCEVTDLGQGFCRVLVRYGFMEDPDVPGALDALVRRGDLRFDSARVSYFLGRLRILALPRRGLSTWRHRFFALLNRNAFAPTPFYRLPNNRVVVLGGQIEL